MIYDNVERLSRGYSLSGGRGGAALP